MRTKPTNTFVTLQHDIKKILGVKFWLLISDKKSSIKSSKQKKRNKPKHKKVFRDSCPEYCDGNLAEKCDAIDRSFLKDNVIDSKAVAIPPAFFDFGYNR